MGFAFICALFLIVLLPISVPLPAQWHTLEILSSGEKNTHSDASQLILLMVQDENGEQINPDSFEQSGIWNQENDSFISGDEHPAELSYRFKHRDGMSFDLLLSTGPASGIIAVKIDQREIRQDLYEEIPGVTILTVPVHYTRYFWLFLLYTADIVTLTLLLYAFFRLSESTELIPFFQKNLIYILLGLIGVASTVLMRKRLDFYNHQDMTFDVRGYIELAEKMKHPFDTGIREPLWIWLVKLFQYLAGGHDIGVSILGIVLFILSAFMLYRMTAAIFRRPGLAVVTVALFSLNPFIIDIAVQGLRDIMNVFTVIGITFFIFNGEHSFNLRQRITGLTVFFILACCTTLSNIAAYSILLLFGFWKNKIPYRYLLFPAIFIGLINIPYLFYCQQVYHDAFYASNTHAIYWRNYEFVTMKQTGCPGCPSPAELAKSSYAGEPTTMLAYILGMHDLPDLVSGTLHGFSILMLSPSKKFANFIGTRNLYWYYLYLIGLVVYLVRFRKYFFLLLVPVLTTNMMAYTIFMSGRIFSAITPFVCLLAAIGFTWLLELVQDLLDIISGLGTGRITTKTILSSVRYNALKSQKAR